MAEGLAVRPQTPKSESGTPRKVQTGDGTSGAGGMVLSETQLGNMALRAKQQRIKAEQDRQLLQVRRACGWWNAHAPRAIRHAAARCPPFLA